MSDVRIHELEPEDARIQRMLWRQAKRASRWRYRLGIRRGTGPVKKYNTDEERKEAKRAALRRFRARQRQRLHEIREQSR